MGNERKNINVAKLRKRLDDSESCLECLTLEITFETKQQIAPLVEELMQALKIKYPKLNFESQYFQSNERYLIFSSPYEINIRVVGQNNALNNSQEAERAIIYAVGTNSEEFVKIYGKILGAK